MLHIFWWSYSTFRQMSPNCYAGQCQDKNDRYMSSGEMTSSGRLALHAYPPDISKKRRGKRRMERQTGERDGVGRIDTLLIIMASL